MSGPARRVDLALLHAPVLNRRGEEIVSAVTNLDLHDIARACATYGVGRYFVVTPSAGQRALVRELVGHWTRAAGGRHNPDRRRALALVRTLPDLAAAVAEVTAEAGVAPRLLATSARRLPGALSWEEARRLAAGPGRPLLLLFGTASGLAPAVIEAADGVLAPVTGAGAYNHLSVRCAAAVVLDRLLGERGGASAQPGPG
ncbi:RNA methyltransferase [Dissulfurirhabdus thermomarina]|uniref:RNA methyltransferase n=1 Tax=Dissulfurirhabdus thermomarina TaxID=1765737 RepID=A0A6N9TPS9_DISTH|nr:RNA methyltransferase [Dissulfurirhabdus thermomarina]NDY41447.1 RNA methyltransferase [Dissulfurirhabdus thermomarina]NMX24271.1 RNA methyltransferase [Dissulfurirhabdus thermomarina]